MQPSLSQSRGEIDGRRCLSDAAFLVCDRNDAGSLGMWELSTRYLVKGEVLGLELIEDRRSGQTCFSSDDNPTARASRAVTSLREQVDPYALHERAPYLTGSSGGESQQRQ